MTGKLKRTVMANNGQVSSLAVLIDADNTSARYAQADLRGDREARRGQCGQREREPHSRPLSQGPIGGPPASQIRNRQGFAASRMKHSGTIVTSAITSLITALAVVWFSDALRQHVPSPQKLELRVRNALTPTPTRADAGFRIVLCWLENDWSGTDTRNVEDAFSGVEGITLVVSDAQIAASGAADEWRPVMQQGALAELDRWNGDVAVVGTVKKPGEVLALWFVPRRGEGTLTRADRPYTLQAATLDADFHEDLRSQLAVMAWNAVAPLADTATRGSVFEKGLRAAAEKLAKLLDTPTIRRPEHRAALYVALGEALSTLAERTLGTQRLEQAVEAYRAALTVHTRERAPLQWAKVQSSLGLALRELADRETGLDRLMQSLAAHHAALDVYSRDHTPFRWAAVQGHLGTVLRRLGTQETGTARLEEAIAAHRAALEVYTPESAPFDWAFEQDHLGNALSLLGERKNSADLMKQAVDAHRAALEVLTRDRVPFSWAANQHNLGLSLMALGQRESGTQRLQQSVDAFREALHVRTRDRTPLDWAATQNALGKALYRLGERSHSTEHFEKARNAYRAALEVLGSEGAPRHREMALRNLEEVTRRLQEPAHSPTPPQ